MRGAAAILQRRGAKISGSDRQEFPELGSLVANGAVVRVGHAAEHVPADAKLVVASAAIPETNPELIEARRAAIPVVSYAELIGRLVSEQVGISIAGAHGKSTTTGMTAHILRSAGLDPSFVVGAFSEQLGGTAGVGNGPHFVVESCEFNRSFLHQRPQFAAILNIDLDHLDYYKDLEDIISAFGAFAANVHPDGVLVTQHGEASSQEAAKQAKARVETIGLTPDACWHASKISLEEGHYHFVVNYRNEPLFDTRLSIPGTHNIYNTLAAAALAHHAGADPQFVAEAIGSYEGVDRRMSLRGTRRGVTIVDDYAHHPTEITSTIQALKGRYTPLRTWIVFQPHQHSRTRQLMAEFATCFGKTDMVLVPDIFAARDSELDRKRTGSQELVTRIQDYGSKAKYIPSLQGVADHLVRELQAGDMVVTMGAGDVWKVADELVTRV